MPQTCRSCFRMLQSASSDLLCRGYRFPATFVLKFDFRLFHPDLLPFGRFSVYKNVPNGQTSYVLRNRRPLSNSSKTSGKRSTVRFLSRPQDRSTLYFQLSWLLRLFRISGQFLWSSVAPVQLGAWRHTALYFASRNQNRVVFRVSLGPQNTGILHVPVWPRSTPVEAVGFELSE